MPRRKAIFAEPKAETPAVAAQNSTNSDARPRRPVRERLDASVLEELWLIWRADPRVPSVKSRRLWAISRNANPRLVYHWFLRRRTCAKKAGQPISDGSYDLPLDPPMTPKREQSTTAIEFELEAIPDLPSDDTLVYASDVDDLNDLEASSDTVFDEDTHLESKRPETPAYKDVPQQPRLEYYHRELKTSSANLHAAGHRFDDDTLFKRTSSPVCNQGWGKQSNFTCKLCSSQDLVQSDSSTMSDYSSIPCPRLDFSPTTLSELSAIPFLFRTPTAVLLDNAVGHRNWAIIEDELGRLSKDGNLDFSFLDVPHLASMELT